MKRPLMLGCLSYVITLAVAVAFLSEYITAAIVIGAIAAVLFFLLSLRFKTLVNVFYITLVCAIALSNLLIFNKTTIAAADNLAEQNVRITGTIIEGGESSSRKPYYVVKVDEIDGEKTIRGLNVRVHGFDYELYNDYDKIDTTATFFKSSNFSSGENYFISNSIYASSIATSEIKVTNSEEFSLLREICKFRDKLCLNLRSFIRGEEGSIACGILFGKSEHISDKTISTFKTAGISHLLVVSGLHLTIIIALIEAILGRLKVNKIIRSSVAVLLAFTMMIMTGFTPSIVRAGIMTIAMLIARIIRHDYDSLTALFFSALIICLANPYVVCNVGFLLSFSATLGIISSNIILSKIRSRFSLKTVGVIKLTLYEILRLILPCCFAFLFTIPITATVFGYISTYSPIVNVLIAPLLTILLALIIISAFIAFLPNNPISFVIFEVTKMLISCINWVASVFSELPMSAIYFENDLLIPFTIAVAVMLLISIRSARPIRNIVCSALLSVCIFCVITLSNAYTYKDTYSISVIDSSVVISDSSRIFITGYTKGASYKIDKLVSQSGNKEICFLSMQDSGNKHTNSLSHFLLSNKVSNIAVSKDTQTVLNSINLDQSCKIYDSRGLKIAFEDIAMQIETYGKNSLITYDVGGYKIARLDIKSAKNLPRKFNCDLLIANETALPFIQYYSATHFILCGETDNPNHLASVLSKYDMNFLANSPSDKFYIRDGSLFQKREIF